MFYAVLYSSAEEDFALLTHTRSRRLALIASAGFVVASNALGQTELVRNWPAPLYWQPSAQESELIKRTVEPSPMIQTPSPRTNPGDLTAPLTFVAITPCRMMDTRGYDSAFTGVYGPPAMAANSGRTLPVAGVTAGHRLP